MKIAILTHPLGTNYGGILQNYALQYVLKSLGHEPITLNHYFKTAWYVKVMSFVKRLSLRIKGRKVSLRAWMTKQEYDKITYNTVSFINAYINVTKRFSFNDVKSLTREPADAIIVGSDQVWRGTNPQIQRFFLSDFQGRNVKRLAYAASFGVNYWEYSPPKTKRCSALLKQFDAISVRERGGVVLCKENLQVDAQQVLDPTLLLESSVYNKLIHQLYINEDKYVLTYILDKSKEKKGVCNKVSECLRMKEYSVIPEICFKEVGSSGIDRCVLPSVESWLQGFRDASFVVTDSFHGTVFSIIFHKPFISIANNRRGKERFISLLSLFHLENRLVEKEEDIPSLLNVPIDYEQVDVILREKRNESLFFLKSNLQ